MLVFHFNIHSMNTSCIRDFNTICIFIYYIPSAFFTIRGNVAVSNILENSLMEIPNVIVIGFIPLTENFIAYNLIPRRLINSFIKNQLNGINYVFVKPLEVKRFELFTIFLNSCFYVICEVLFTYKRQVPHHKLSNASLIFTAIS